jgi:hypothetical protein
MDSITRLSIFVFFCINSDGDPDIPHRLVSDSYSVNSIEKCGDLFLKLIAHTAAIHFVPADFPTIFTDIAHSTNNRTFLQLLQLCRSMASKILKHPSRLECRLDLVIFVENSDIEIVEAVIIALHELLQHQCHVSMMAVAFRLSKSKNLGSVFDRLNSRFNEYPNLFPLLSGFALQFTDSQRTKLCNAIITLCEPANSGWLRFHRP